MFLKLLVESSQSKPLLRWKGLHGIVVATKNATDKENVGFQDGEGHPSLLRVDLRKYFPHFCLTFAPFHKRVNSLYM